MSWSEFWSRVTFADVMALFGAIGLAVGGAALIASRIPMRAELVARRVKLALPHGSAVRARSGEDSGSSLVQRLPYLALGLSAAEQRLVISWFSKFGVSDNSAPLFFNLFRLGAAFVLGALTLFVSGYVGVFAASWLLRMAAAVGVAIAVWIIPALIIASAMKRRAKSVAAGLPDALELLVVCVEAGLSLEDALQRVAHELKDSQPSLADELAQTWAEMNILPSRAQALANLAERVNNPGVRSVVSLLSQSLKLGTPLAQSLRTGTIELRNDQMTLLEERASKLPALMTLPVMLFIMPTIFLIVGGPAALRIMDIFQGGAH
jgi:tight adherence protein C